MFGIRIGEVQILDNTGHLCVSFVFDVAHTVTGTSSFSVCSSAVARGGAGGARAPPVFFLESKNRPV